MRQDPKCWLCGIFQMPVENSYQPLICPECLPEYKKRSFSYIRPSEQEIKELLDADQARQAQVRLSILQNSNLLDSE